jgi:hypothetical protein
VNRSPPTRQLREHPDLDQLKRQAKELLDAYTAGDAARPSRKSVRTTETQACPRSHCTTRNSSSRVRTASPVGPN